MTFLSEGGNHIRNGFNFDEVSSREVSFRNALAKDKGTNLFTFAIF